MLSRSPLRLARRPGRNPSRTAPLLAVIFGLLALFQLTGASERETAEASYPASPQPAQAQLDRGRKLFTEGCSSCHGLDARGIEGQGPNLHGAGALSADFYLSTGRMPLSDPGQEPQRGQPAYPPSEIKALDAYIGSLGGPGIPTVDTSAGSLSDGLKLFTENCGGCHQVVARGGVVTGAFAPSLTKASPTEVAQAIRIGPYLMPAFPRQRLSDHDVNSIARYVEYAKHPNDAGGWGIGNIGPVPEGMIAWLLAIATLLFVARAIGERVR